MLNTIKMDLYRMIRSKSFYVTILISMIMVIAGLATTKYQMQNPDFNAMMSEAQEQMGDLNVGVSMGASMQIDDSSTLADIIVNIMSGGSLILFSTIFCVIFVCSEHGCGFIKNVVSRRGYRTQFTLSKAFSLSIYLLVHFAVMLFFVSIATPVILGIFHLGSVGELFAFLGVQYLMHLAIMMLILLVCNATRSIAISMATAMFVCTGIMSLITGLLDKMDLGIVFTDYLLSIGMKTLPNVYNSESYIRLMLTAIISIVGYWFVSTLLMRRQDIK